MFAELEAAALRSYPRAVSLEDRYEDLLPEVMLGVDAEQFRPDRGDGVHAHGRCRRWVSSTCTT